MDLCYMTASEARRRFAEGSLSPVELVSALIERIEAVNPPVNALTYSFPERALTQAKKAEARYRARGAKARPLEGLPVMIKDGHDVKGEITTYGSRLYADHRPETSYYHIERLFRAGAILLGRTTTPEFGAATICHSDLWGVTRNPWNLEKSPAGSGGGAGAALALGMTPLCDGADYGGSIRNPASASGVVGFRSPSGRIPKRPPWNFNNWSAFGPMTRSVADAALMENVMAGPHLGDIMSLPTRKLIPKVLEGISGWRIACSPDLGHFPIDPDVAANTKRALEAFRELGCEVEEVALPWGEEVLSAAMVHYRTFKDLGAEDMTDQQKALLCDFLRRGDEYFQGRNKVSLARSTELRGEMYQALEPIFRRCRVLLCPTLALPAPPAELHPIDGDVRINGVKVDPTLGWTLCYPINMLGQLPAISVPSGFASNGVPTGLQIVGRPYDDVSVFRAAAAFEGARPWDGHRPEL